MAIYDLTTGAGLRALRTARGLSRPALAKAAEIDPYTVRYWERKTRWRDDGWAVKRMLGVLLPGYSRTLTRPRILGFEAIDAQIDALHIEPRPQRQSPPRCGAKTRKGRPCRCRAIPGKRRCKFNGGMSTGPKTPDGKARVARATRARWAKWREDRAQFQMAGR